MCKYMSGVVNIAASSNQDLTVEERNLFSVAFKVLL